MRKRCEKRMEINKQLLRKVRRERNLSQTELAKMLGVSKTSISKYESGKHNPSLKVISLYSQVFNISIEAFLLKL
ncbi:helix-turn-helix transcriptional regulator [Bacillus thuringiensis]|uniref:helix-turn-helix domain-containing protein n=1 Tax=Bacillus thuringiensis TaxID=1428 RepID=UPI002E2104C9|nr:helix-turn-helix transcriptional regulator [Bacillus thuringiensis]MED2755536.1 helix-turn-helix transcriptional regulator [Bacillus thuringiensis]MED2769783.1 helix-turn-helix transcriptional regulator [Bacillus thuringiensis]MED2773434.1 helix-turn-helix transcriptional regulator [Bacillus thuringiensis]MED2782718.1 helix-turn-helix transcriptional regulator [Bacillus thuringiensis]